MKKLFTLVICVILILVLCGCGGKSNKNATSKDPVKINLPSDDSVNGYRINSSSDKEKIEGHNQNSYTYFGNKNSKKFHLSSCSIAKNTKDENRIYYKTRNEYISDGYSPCKSCNP